LAVAEHRLCEPDHGHRAVQAPQQQRPFEVRRLFGRRREPFGVDRELRALGLEQRLDVGVAAGQEQELL
jgi:hypothetical protein